MSQFWRFKMTIHRLKCVTTETGRVVDEFCVSQGAQEEDNKSQQGLQVGSNLQDLIACIKENLLGATVTAESYREDEEYDTTIRRTRKLTYGKPGQLLAGQEYSTAIRSIC